MFLKYPMTSLSRAFVIRVQKRRMGVEENTKWKFNNQSDADPLTSLTANPPSKNLEVGYPIFQKIFFFHVSKKSNKKNEKIERLREEPRSGKSIFKIGKVEKEKNSPQSVGPSVREEPVSPIWLREKRGRRDSWTPLNGKLGTRPDGWYKKIFCCCCCSWATIWEHIAARTHTQTGKKKKKERWCCLDGGSRLIRYPHYTLSAVKLFLLSSESFREKRWRHFFSLLGCFVFWRDAQEEDRHNRKPHRKYGSNVTPNSKNLPFSLSLTAFPPIKKK